MDPWDAARREAEPFNFERPLAQLPIGQRGLIGDGRTCALVRVDGAIDWLCAPTFEGPSVFGAMLDPARGGSTSIRPTTEFASIQRYAPESNVLETLFRVGSAGLAQLTDLMPWPDGPSGPEIHRRLECLEGEVELEVVFDPRFDYGRATTTVSLSQHGAIARGDGASLCASVDGGVWATRAEGGVVCRLRLRAGESAWMVLSPGAEPRPPSAYRPDARLASTERHWRAFVEQLRYDGAHRAAVVRSALLLKLLVYTPSGAMVAAPTTSLPEWLGGSRNWDYRYTWIRDAAMSFRAANRVGCDREAADFLEFVRRTMQRDPTLPLMVTIDSKPVPAEKELTHLAGFEGSAPVRIGNGARHQLQHDITGPLLDAAELFTRRGGALTPAVWACLCDAVEQTRARWREPDHGIWEPRHGARHNVHSKLMGWVALERGARLATRLGHSDRARSWALEAELAREDILAHGVDETGCFTAAYGEAHADAALLLAPLMGLVPPDDPRALATIERTRAELSAGPYVYRYHVDDGIGEPEGCFVLCGFWLAEALALTGRVNEAQAVFDAHTRAANHLGLLAEEVDPQDGAPLGNFPQAFSHLGLINAALALDAAR